MSKEQAIAFFEEISKNQQLAKEVEKVVEGKNSDEAKVKELLSLAKKYNFNFSVEEAKSAQEALKKPLSPEEMLEVSGGKLNLKFSLMAMALLAGLGVGGAALHNMEASAGGPGAAQGQSGQGNANDDDSATITNEEVRRMEEDAMQPAQGRPFSVFQPSRHLSFTVYDGREPRQPNHFNALPEHGALRRDGDGIPAAQRGLVVQPAFRGAAGEAIYPAQQTRRQPTQTNQQKKELVFDPKLVGQPGSITQVVSAFEREQREKRLQKQAAKQRREREERERPKLPVDRAEHRAEAKQMRDRHPHRDAGWKIKSALTPTDLEALLKKYRSGAAERLDDRRWIISVARAVANGKRPNLDLQLTTAPREDFRTRCAYCGRDGCVTVSTPKSKGRSCLRCRHEDCPLHWVNHLRYREIYASTAPIAPLDYEIQRWESLPQLIPEIENLVARTEYDNHGNAVRLHDYAETARQEELMRRAELRRRAIEKLRRGETLSIEEAKAIAPTLKCGECGENGAYVWQAKGSVYFRCANKKCRKCISSKKPEALLAMLPAAAPGNVPMEMVQAESNEPQMQMTPQPTQMTMPQNITHNDYGMDFDENEDYVDRDFYDSGGKLRKLLEDRPPEVKERREDYENPEPYVPGPGMVGYVDPQDAGKTRAFSIDFGAHFEQMSEDNSDTVPDENIQMMEEDSSVEDQTRAKGYENQETNPNIPQLPHLQPHESMILENTNETITPLEPTNLDDISDLLVDELLNDNPDVNRIKRLLQRAREVQNPGHSVNGFTNFNDLINFVLEVANDFGRDAIISLIDSWR